MNHSMKIYSLCVGLATGLLFACDASRTGSDTSAMGTDSNNATRSGSLTNEEVRSPGSPPVRNPDERTPGTVTGAPVLGTQRNLDGTPATGGTTGTGTNNTGTTGSNNMGTGNNTTGTGTGNNTGTGTNNTGRNNTGTGNTGTGTGNNTGTGTNSTGKNNTGTGTNNTGNSGTGTNSGTNTGTGTSTNRP